MTMLPSAWREHWDRPLQSHPTTQTCSTPTEGLERSAAARSVAKRMIDFVGAFLGLLLLLPVIGFIAVLIRLDSKGPVLFRQQRVGLGGKVFWCFKFRTMVVDAESRLQTLEAHNESSCGVLFKIKNDPRITSLGRILRRTSLDEVPQLWNVLRGEMSLIGPRPLQIRDSDRLAMLEPEGFARRLTALPGLSGPWQVAGRSNLDGGKMLDLDLKYIDEKTKIADVSQGKQWVPVEVYEKNLTELVQRLKKTGAKLIWCTTTPVPEGAHGRVPGEEAKYNAAALRVMQAAGVPVDDLCAFVAPQRAKLGLLKDVHYTSAGYAALAGEVVKALEPLLAK